MIPWNVVAFCVAAVFCFRMCTTEYQRLAIRIYIYWSIILGNLLWVIGLATHFEDLEHASKNPWIEALFLPCFFVAEVVCIKLKNFKYACKSWKKEAKDDDY